MSVEIESLKTTFLPYVKSIQDFNFHYSNPLILVFFMTVFLMLVWFRGWSRRKAFFFCLTMSLILLSMTWAEKSIRGIFVRPDESFDPFIIRVVSLVAISVTMLYYTFIDNS
ncbi:MAG: hypothetical protein Q8N76_05730 [Candidatus Omnitrophota bacterium]|nr:hypothetical protein [Candidatus Omnitrophota bacterium]